MTKALALLICTAFAFGLDPVRAAEITGTVGAVNDTTVTIAVDGDLVPSAGDKAEIFFKIAGSEDEISVATGKVTAVDATAITMRIEAATGSVEKDQRVRFTAGVASKTTAGQNSIIGEWVAKPSETGKFTFVFKEDGTASWAGEALKANGKYRVDYTQTPHQIDIVDIDPRGAGLYGIFEFQTDGTMKMFGSEKLSERPTAFGDHTPVFSRSQESAGASAPISPLPAATDKTAAQPSLVGNWVGTFGNGDKYSFTFKEDQTLAWTIDAKTESSGVQPQMTLHARYRLDYTTKPPHIDMFDFDSERVPKGETMHGLFEFQGDAQLKMDLSTGAHENPEKGFTGAAVIFLRVP